MCSKACPFIVVGMPLGVPGGKPSPGSAWKMPPAMVPVPKTTTNRGAHRPPILPPSARPIPTAPAMVSNPVRRKLAFWIQPRSPIPSRLTA
jgi:hypothetical protein